MRFISTQRLRGFLGAATQNAAVGAALALVVIQVGIGLIMKTSQTGGKYAFSPSSSVAIAEFLKLLLSICFFWRECKARVVGAPHHSTLPTSKQSVSESKPFIEEPESNGSGSTDARIESYSPPRLNLYTFWIFVKSEVSLDIRYGFAQLALVYVLINNMIFVSYKLADPGTISLTKSGATLITALVMIATLGTRISKIQWIAIVIQICGLAVTQYHPEAGSAYPFTTYLILLFQVFLSASSGVYNQALLKSGNASLHAANINLYACGATINFILHIVVRVVKADEPGFFTGYGSWSACLVILSNVFIGLAITAVYKYADAVIKCFATALSTGILLYLSPILFGTEITFLVLPGTILVFIASWLYMEAAPSAETGSPQQQAARDDTSSRSVWGKLITISKLYRNGVLGAATAVTILICAFMTMSNSSMPDFSKHKSSNLPSTPKHSSPAPQVAGDNSAQTNLLESPFKNTLAFIRWNSEHPERMPLLQKYGPFFHDLHFSMPNYVKDKNLPEGFHNLTHDSSGDSAHIYRDISKTMQILLDAPAGSKDAEINGMLYFHFDAWIDPLDYAAEDFNKIWIPDVPDQGVPGGPRFECMENREKYPWWGFMKDNMHEQAMNAAREIEKSSNRYTVNTKEWCVGWTDIYYIPKEYFADYVYLSSVFGGIDVFHEVAVPTIIHIIDQSRRLHRSRSILSRFGDCWGYCCASDPDIHDVLFNRCGHRLDYLKEEVVNAHYDRLVVGAGMIGESILSSRVALHQDE